MRHFWVLLIFAGVVHAEQLSFRAATFGTMTNERHRCILDEVGRLFRPTCETPIDGQSELKCTWEQCTIEAGWVGNAAVNAKMRSEEVQKLKFEVVGCRCQHE